MLANKLDLQSWKVKVLVALLFLAALVPVVGTTLVDSRYPSLEKAEEACIAWQQSGNVHESLTDREAWDLYGREVGQGSCDYVTPSLTRRFFAQMKGKELVKFRYCLNNKATNTIEGRRNEAMEVGLNGDNGTYQAEQTFRY